jgi:hypothetical protein
MPGQIARVAVRGMISMASGVLLGALYAALVGTVHLGAYGRWEGIPGFAVGCILVGALLGLLGCILWAVWGEAAWGSAGSESPPSGSPGSGPARRTAEGGTDGERRPVRPCDGAPGDRLAPRRGCWSGMWRNFASPN